MNPAEKAPAWLRYAPAAALLALVVAAALLLPRAWVLASAPLVGAYMITPLAKETYVALAEPVFGVPAPLAVVLLLGVETMVIGIVLLLFPVETLTRALDERARSSATSLGPLAKIAPKVAKFEARVRSSRLARRGLGVALAGVIALPFHSGGAILGTLAGRALGLPRLTTYLAIISGMAVRFLVVLLLYEGWVALT